MAQKNYGESTPFFREGPVTSAGGAHPTTAGRRRLAGPMSALGLAIGILVVATGGVNRRSVPVVPDVADSLPELVTITHRTWECGTSSRPVLNSADVVAYFSLEDGEGAIYGTVEHELVYNGYLFRFVSAENKALFEVRRRMKGLRPGSN